MLYLCYMNNNPPELHELLIIQSTNAFVMNEIIYLQRNIHFSRTDHLQALLTL